MRAVDPRPPRAPRTPMTQGRMDQVEARFRQLRPDLSEEDIKARGRAALNLKSLGASDTLTAQLLCAQRASDGEISACAARPVGVKLRSSKIARGAPVEHGFREAPLSYGIPGWLSQNLRAAGRKPAKYAPRGPLPSSKKVAEESGALLRELDQLVREAEREPKPAKAPKPAKVPKVKVAKAPKPAKVPKVKVAKAPKPAKVPKVPKVQATKAPKHAKAPKPAKKTAAPTPAAPTPAASTPTPAAPPPAGSADADAKKKAARAKLKALLSSDD